MGVEWKDVEKIVVDYGPTVVGAFVDGFRYLMSLSDVDRERTIADLAKKRSERDGAIGELDAAGDELEQKRAAAQKELEEMVQRQAREQGALANKHDKEREVVLKKLDVLGGLGEGQGG